METKELNPEQLQAIQVNKRAVLIVAGPGTGKTLTLTHRIVHLMKTQKVLPENILAVTFTNKAAQEMHERIAVLNSAASKMPLITTFHGLCYKILSELNGPCVDGSATASSHTIIDESGQVFYFNADVDLFKGQGGKVSANPARGLEYIRLAKQVLMEPDDIGGVDAPGFDTGLGVDALSGLYGLYQQLLSHQRLYDFEDLILKAVKRLESDPVARKIYQDRFLFIFVDEFQDINLGQHRLLQLLSHPATQLCVIGDPDQSIYGFRGSDVKYFHGFISDFADTEVIKLTRNYRSTRTIVDAAQQIIVRHPAGTKRDSDRFAPLLTDESCRRNYSTKEGFKTIVTIATATERAEAVAVGKIIETMIGGTGFHFIDFNTPKTETTERDRSFSDFAVLYRTGSQGKIFSDVFSAAGIPHQLVHRGSAYADKKVCETLSLLRILAKAGSLLDMERLKNIISPRLTPGILNTFSKWSFENKTNLHESLNNVRRFPISGMSKKDQKQLNRFLDRLDQLRQETENMTVRETIRHIFEQNRPDPDAQKKEQSILALRRLMVLSENYGRRLMDFITALALQTDTDTYLPQSERVALMTMHAAKGLEFPVVFICGCENGYIPLRRAGKAQTDIAEERRLFYVAMTRAKERLFFTHARKRRIYGKNEIRTVSPFVEQIDSALKEAQASFDQKKKAQRQLELF
ncbi:MAG: ATP-dependent helicase [Desulfobacterales bacterium]|nr:ATP-dependent helicase [Desulfobacterales bacterium]